MNDATQIREVPEDTSVRDGLEIGVYLSVVLVALMLGLEDSLDEGGELLLIWGTSIGLTLAHVFAFRVAWTYQHGIAFTSGWRPIRAMLLVAVVVGMTASIPYLEVLGLAKPSLAARWILTAVVAVAAYLAARSRGLSLAGRLAYSLVITLVAASVSVLKYLLTR
ncbi:MAG: hypothetical protein ACC658_02235 [Acidimicrobiia bacterium]